MQDDIKQLFEGFDPDVSSDADFMQRLESGLDRFELVKESGEVSRRRRRRAAVLAACAGFVAGIIFTCLLPSFAGLLARLDWQPVAGVLSDSTVSLLMASVIVASASIFAAYNTYEISLAAMTQGCRKSE